VAGLVMTLAVRAEGCAAAGRGGAGDFVAMNG
jgi:hypothetical protein